ncbi:hypothetical protein FRB90_003797 [Tulasnella sp. 427]|nr:hypothetical protein FRB90_003797 [Tulasnella sp. 427]
MSLEERGFDGGGKRRRAIKKTKGRSRVADLEGDSTGRRASTLDQPAAGENELGIPNQTISGPSTLWTSRGSPTPLTSASVPSNAAFALPFPTYFTTSTASPSTAFELLASNDDESF